jgi:hypothetical protein
MLGAVPQIAAAIITAQGPWRDIVFLVTTARDICDHLWNEVTREATEEIINDEDIPF